MLTSQIKIRLHPTDAAGRSYETRLDTVALRPCFSASLLNATIISLNMRKSTFLPHFVLVSTVISNSVFPQKTQKGKSLETKVSRLQLVEKVCQVQTFSRI